MKTLKLFLAGFIINLLWFVFAHAYSSTEVKISEPLGGDILPGKQFFRSDIASGIKDSFLFSQWIPFTIKYGIRIAIGASVIAIIYAGYQMIIAFGDAEKTKEAGKIITYALLGLAISLTAFGLVSILTSIKIV